MGKTKGMAGKAWWEEQSSIQTIAGQWQEDLRKIKVSLKNRQMPNKDGTQYAENIVQGKGRKGSKRQDRRMDGW